MDNKQNSAQVEVLPPVNGGSLVTQRPESGQVSLQALETMTAAVDHRINLMDRMKQVIDARVSPNCFDRFTAKKDGADVIVVRRNKNYADTMAAVLGICFEYLKDEKGRPIFTRTNFQDDKGAYYIYEVFGRAFIPGFWGGSECSGSASSRDPFLSRNGGLDETEVNESHIRQKALTECRKKGILAVLGLDANGTEEDMSRVGKDATKLAGHTFANGSKGGNTATGALADKKSDIERMARDLVNAGWKKAGEPIPTTADQVVLTITKNDAKNFPGWRTIKGISERGLEFTWKDVKKVWDEVIGSQGGGGEPSAEEKKAIEEQEAREAAAR
jgi:hypothetical protein